MLRSSYLETRPRLRARIVANGSHRAGDALIDRQGRRRRLNPPLGKSADSTVASLHPILDPSGQQFEFKPVQMSRTGQNALGAGAGAVKLGPVESGGHQRFVICKSVAGTMTWKGRRPEIKTKMPQWMGEAPTCF